MGLSGPFISQAELDIGQQAVLEEPVAVKPGPNFTRALALRTFKRDTDRYTMFGWVGTGHGGYSISCKDPDLQGEIGQCIFLKFKLYPGGWVHHLKACGLPPVQFPEAFTHQQQTRLQGKVEGMAEAMVEWWVRSLWVRILGVRDLWV